MNIFMSISLCKSVLLSNSEVRRNYQFPIRNSCFCLANAHFQWLAQNTVHRLINVKSQHRCKSSESDSGVKIGVFTPVYPACECMAVGFYEIIIRFQNTILSS